MTAGSGLCPGAIGMTKANLTRSFNGNNPKVNPFRAPHRLRLNLAIGANGGDPSNTAFPARDEVDYVRIYQKRNAAFDLKRAEMSGKLDFQEI